MGIRAYCFEERARGSGGKIEYLHCDKCERGCTILVEETSIPKKGRYLIIPGRVQKTIIGENKTAYVETIGTESERRNIAQLIREHGLEGKIVFWD